eukprot:3175059-Amphidinium_carterae.2
MQQIDMQHCSSRFLEEFAQQLSAMFNNSYMNPDWVHMEFTEPFEPHSDETRGTFMPFVRLNALFVVMSLALSVSARECWIVETPCTAGGNATSTCVSIVVEQTFASMCATTGVFAMAWDAVLFRVVAALIAPLWATYLAASFTRWVVFGPITTQYLFFGHVLQYSTDCWVKSS